MDVSRYTGPVIGAERGGRETFPTKHVTIGVVGPGITYRNGIFHRIAPNFYRILVHNTGGGPKKLLVFSGDGKANRLTGVESLKAAGTDMVKVD